VDAQKFAPDPAVPRSGRALFVGRLLPHKGVADLLGALPPEMALDVVGPVSDRGYLKRLKAEAEGRMVQFHHDCDDPALVDAYRRALCVVLPSVYRTDDGTLTKVPELLGQTLLEAMACGTPVICTRVASLPEIVEDGTNGFVVEAGDREALGQRLRWLSEHRYEAAALGAEGRRTVLARFQWPRVVARCLDAYESL
jgi:glycosyltransferase involved in cell wall biosynthesis